MIISHRHRFIFIKTRKTAGTSVEKALAALCGDEDVLTRDVIRALNKDELKGHARNYDGRTNPVPEMLMHLSPVAWARILRDCWKRPRFYNHMRASSVMARTAATVWRDYYKFCFERNPWDKCVSYYYWMHRGETLGGDVNAYLEAKPLTETVDQHYPCDWDRYALGDRILLNKVYDFNDVEAGLRDALTHSGVSRSIIDRLDVPRLKSQYRNPTDDIRLSKRTVETIRHRFRREIRYFGYTVPDDLAPA